MRSARGMRQRARDLRVPGGSKMHAQPCTSASATCTSLHPWAIVIRDRYEGLIGDVLFQSRHHYLLKGRKDFPRLSWKGKGDQQFRPRSHRISDICCWNESKRFSHLHRSYSMILAQLRVCTLASVVSLRTWKLLPCFCASR